MENIEKIKEELFKDFKPNYEINEDTPIYIAKLCGDFKDVVNRDINIDFQKELYKILPKDVITLGYMCRGCGTWMDATPSSLSDAPHD